MPRAGIILAAVAAGGALGTWGRLVLLEALPVEPGRVPWATLLANVIGCLVLGALAARRLVHPYRRALVGAGLCGGLTTFSTVQVEVLELGSDGHAALGAVYLVASVALGLAAARAGAAVVRA